MCSVGGACFRHPPALRTPPRRGAQIVPTLRAKPGALAMTRATHPAKMQRRKDREEQGEEPVRDANQANLLVNAVPEAKDGRASSVRITIKEGLQRIPTSCAARVKHPANRSVAVWGAVVS